MTSALVQVPPPEAAGAALLPSPREPIRKAHRAMPYDFYPEEEFKAFFRDRDYGEAQVSVFWDQALPETRYQRIGDTDCRGRSTSPRGQRRRNEHGRPGGLSRGLRIAWSPWKDGRGPLGLGPPTGSSLQHHIAVQRPRPLGSPPTQGTLLPGKHLRRSRIRMTSAPPKVRDQPADVLAVNDDRGFQASDPGRPTPESLSACDLPASNPPVAEAVRGIVPSRC